MTDPATAAPAEVHDPPLPARKSLRAKAFVATLALLAYVLASVAYVATERTQIYQSMQALDSWPSTNARWR
jgi:hypothetical protein